MLKNNILALKGMKQNTHTHTHTHTQNQHYCPGFSIIPAAKTRQGKLQRKVLPNYRVSN